MLYPKSASHFSHRLYHKLFVCPNASMLKEYIKQFSCQISGVRWLIPNGDENQLTKNWFRVYLLMRDWQDKVNQNSLGSFINMN